MQSADFSALIALLSLIVALVTLLGTAFGNIISTRSNHTFQREQQKTQIFIDFLNQAANINFGQPPKDESAYNKAFLAVYLLSPDELRVKLHAFNQHVIGTQYMDAALMLEDITADISNILELHR